jgi:hypothetical protein
MTGPLYPAAQLFAGKIEDHFARHGAGRPSEAPLPDARAIEAMIDAAFWASLQREEGYEPEISLTFLPPERALRPLRFERPLALSSRALARLAPAVERPGIHLGVFRQGAELFVWGTTRAVPSFCFVVEVLGPGLLVVKHRVQEDSSKFRNIAVFEGEEVKILNPRSVDTSDLPALLKPLAAPEFCGTREQPDDVLLRLAVSMRAHKRGGTLLVVPAETDAWRESIVKPITYAVHPFFSELSDLAREKAQDGQWHGAIGRVVDAVAGLTAVDGATLITDRYEVLAFGVTIARPDGRHQVEKVLFTEPIEGGAAIVVTPGQLGGTRHISAAQFAQDRRDAVALVASTDGHFTLFAWSPRAGMVHAHRVEALLL